MSSTLTMTQMVAKFQYKTAIGIPNATAVDYINEAFRKLNQMSKGGFVWQFKQGTVTVPPGFQTNVALPQDFDPGKTAILRGNGSTQFGAVATMIPYLPMKDFVNQEHFQSMPADVFSAWTWLPNFNSPLTFAYVMQLAPQTAYPTAGGTLPFFYHALVQPPVALGANYFPTPDQFDSMIVDLAIAEARNVYGLARQDNEMQLAMQAIMEVVDTYRTDRYDLAGLTDQMAQAQEKAVEKAK